jgi:hypothetical protein
MTTHVIQMTGTQVPIEGLLARSCFVVSLNLGNTMIVAECLAVLLLKIVLNLVTA